jgi:hypothetical protein
MVIPSIKRFKSLLQRALKASDRFPFLDQRQPINKWKPEAQEAIRPLLISMALHPRITNDLSELDAPSLVAEWEEGEKEMATQAAKEKAAAAARKLSTNREAMVKQCKEWLVKEVMELYRDKEGRPVTKTGSSVRGSASSGTGGAGGSGSSSGSSSQAGGRSGQQQPDKFKMARSRSVKILSQTERGEPAQGAQERSAYQQLHHQAVAEVDRFFANKVLEEDEEVMEADGEEVTVEKEVKSVLEKWRDEWAILYPLIAIVAKAFLAIPTASACTETTFSRAGAIINPKRSSMAPATASRVIKLHDNMHPCLLDPQGYRTERSRAPEKPLVVENPAWRPPVRMSRRKPVPQPEEVEKASAGDDVEGTKAVQVILEEVLGDVASSMTAAEEQGSATADAEGEDQVAVPSSLLVEAGDDGQADPEVVEDVDDVSEEVEGDDD